MYTMLLVACLLGCAYFLHWCMLRHYKSFIGHLPSYIFIPLIGSMYKLTGGSRSLFLCFTDMTKIIEEKTMPFVFWIGYKPMLVLSDYDDLKTVSSACVEKPHYYTFGRIWLGDGLVTAPGHIWKKNIKKIAGTFTRSVVDGYQEIFNAQAQVLVEKLKKNVDNPPFDAMPYFAYTTLEAICQSGLGVSRISDSVLTEEYYRAFNKTLELLLKRALNLIYHSEWLFFRSSLYKELVKNINVIHHVSDTVIKKRKIDREAKVEAKNNAINMRDNDSDKRQFKAVLDILLDLSETDPSLTDYQIKSEVNTIILGGQETVATTIFYTLLILGSKPDIQQKLIDEIKSVFGDSKRSIQRDDLLKLTYCEAVINEILRMYPPLPAVLRQVDRDIELKSCIIPKGASCLLNLWGSGRSKRMWGPDAAEFKPERWLPPNEPPVNSLMAFSIGKRSCIGRRYAIAFAKTMLTYCVRDLEFKSNTEKLDFKLDIALRPISGHLMQVKLRDL